MLIHFTRNDFVVFPKIVKKKYFDFHTYNGYNVN